MKHIITLAILFFLPTLSFSQMNSSQKSEVYPFGEGGQHKMLYDRRQRSQAVLMDNEIHLVYNGGAPSRIKTIVKTTLNVITFNLKTKSFSESIQLPGEPSNDHHYGPVIWADSNNYLHVLSGCHRTPGTHAISKEKASIGTTSNDWRIGQQIAPSLSYPSASSVLNNRHLVFYRVYEHRSSWTYGISDAEGKSWSTPKNSIVDLNNGDELRGLPYAEADEASSYHTYMADPDGKSIHVVFMYYDDNKGNFPEKNYNPLYKTEKNLNLKTTIND